MISPKMRALPFDDNDYCVSVGRGPVSFQADGECASAQAPACPPLGVDGLVAALSEPADLPGNAV